MISRLRFNAATKKELRPFKNPGKDRPSLHKYKKNSTSNFAHTSETSPVTSIKSVWLTLANASIFIGGTYLVLSGASIAWELNNKSSKIVKLLKSENWAVVERPNPKNIKELVSEFYLQKLNFLWNNQFQLHYKVIGTIALLNLVVCFVWRKMAITQSFMRRYFICDILSKNKFRSSSMLLSTISHERIFPLLVNVCIFANIGVAVAENMGAEQFVFFFASSALFTSFAGVVSSLMTGTRYPVYGLGPVIFALTTYFLYTYRHAKLQLTFLPRISITFVELLRMLYVYLIVGSLLCTKHGRVSWLVKIAGTEYGWYYAKHGKSKYTEKLQRVAKRIR